ncbi:rhodanese-like domain-containing protein [Streptomyces sp. N2-109]|uniref:Rhodanese-like domain-containing protein n=1 Tax=Streptomyces gossypii TaxID=2883101 RepID=A0ABT2K2E5_9ACTN|nr:rhodanese-like domain-containing protein [Streptomyces gossypii]MCT2593809.1 rhodanese-like domain-containing protein [Streptomyces gossypii]
MTTPASLVPAQAASRLGEFTLIDVRTPGEYASGHLPGARNIPLDRLDEALPALRAAGARSALLVVCASGARSARACQTLAEADTAAATLAGGTAAWAGAGYPLDHPEGARAVWPMERQVRLAAGGLVLLGLAAGRRAPAARWLAAGIGAGLVFSAATDTCGMASVLSRLPHNRPPQGTDDFHATLAELGG